MNSLYGYQIVVNPDTYRTLSADVPVTPEFRAETDAWMRTFFAPRNKFADGVVQPLGGKLYMNPRTFETVKQEFGK